ncbi:MAG: adenine phosphoribosyltransferase [Pseudomonadota bacterium]
MLTRNDFHTLFQSPGPVILPVIHVLDGARTQDNIERVVRAGLKGCFLINHDFEKESLIPILREVRAAFPSLWMGVNFLAVTGSGAFPILGDLARSACHIDAYWADDACIDEDGDNAQAAGIARVREESGWKGLYFGGTAFKKQRPVAPDRYGDAARNATPFMDVITTSGVATGHEADPDKIIAFRAAIGERPLALASGITPENAHAYGDVDCFMVATGINVPDNFYDIDPDRLAALIDACKRLG